MKHNYQSYLLSSDSADWFTFEYRVDELVNERPAMTRQVTITMT